MPDLHHAFIALGANIGDPMITLEKAAKQLAEHPCIQLNSHSSYYLTAPIGLTAQPDFINAVCHISTILSPAHLLQQLHHIEEKFGRTRNYTNEPRPLDLDLILYDQEVINTLELTIPHPRMHLRAFVLIPLLEIAPNSDIPKRGTAHAWLPAVSCQRIEKLSTAPYSEITINK